MVIRERAELQLRHRLQKVQCPGELVELKREGEQGGQPRGDSARNLVACQREGLQSVWQLWDGAGQAVGLGLEDEDVGRQTLERTAQIILLDVQSSHTVLFILVILYDSIARCDDFKHVFTMLLTDW